MVERAPPPARDTLKRIMAEWVELYSYVLPPGGDIPISTEPFLVDNSVPTEDGIELTVKRLHNHRSGVPSGMRSEHLKRWLTVARKKAKGDTT